MKSMRILRPAALLLAAFGLAVVVRPALAADLHVATTKGDDIADGSAEKPFKTIMAAAQKALPGDSVPVHAGAYRERVNPPRGGTSDTRRITYQAAKGEPVGKLTDIYRNTTPS